MKKLLSFIFTLCLIIPCGFMLTACGGGNNCQHEWSVSGYPTMQNSGYVSCSLCGQDGFSLPQLNETDYQVVGTNPDYKIYKYTKDGETFNIAYNNFEVLFDNDNGYMITNYNGNSTNVVVPETIIDVNGELPVSRISDEAFLNKTQITSISLPNGIKNISNGAFRGCSSLNSINLPEGIEFIGNYAFTNTALTEVIIPSSVTMIGNAFEDCNLQKISITFTGSYPGSVAKFGSIFGDANSNDRVPSSLKEVTITGSYDIQAYAFENAINIETIILDGAIRTINQYAFYECSGLKNVVLNNNLVEIKGCAFESCVSLEEITISKSVQTIGNAAFYQCNSLEKVYYMGSKTEWNAISIGTYNDNNAKLNNANRYYYSETAPTAVDYLNNNKQINTWHYDNNNEVLWTINETNCVDDKTFEYSHSEVELSNEYWEMLLSAKSQGMLGMLFDNDQTQIEMVTSSANKEEYAEKLANYYADVATALSVSFADGKVTLEQTADSVQLDYVEIDGEVYYTLTKTKAFTIDSTNSQIYEETITEYITVKHIYDVQ